jgi:tRNA(Ile)-lysidine synthase
MAALHPAVAAVRAAVRRALIPLPPGGPVLVACSGGADSLALAAATAFVAPRLGRDPALITVDHGLQPGSSEVADAVRRWAQDAGFEPVEVAAVRVTDRGLGPEAAAREARYAVLTGAARRLGAAALLLGHTRDDQAETVLLAMARGAGPRGLAGMPAARHVDGVCLMRPLLDVSRDETRKACAALGLTPWEDPHNVDPSYARSRVRSAVLPALSAALGPGVVDNLARTAKLVAADAAALDALAGRALDAARTADGGLSVAELSGLQPALRSRVLHAWALELGAPGAALSHRHVAALDALVIGWRGQGAVYLPAGIEVSRAGDRLRATDPPHNVDHRAVMGH